METAAPGKTRVGWIGTGVMGASMAGHIRKAGYALTVFSRTRAKVEVLLGQGAAWANTPAELAAGCDVIFTMVGFPSDLRQVALETGGIIHGARPGSVVVDMTTSEPALARELYTALKAKGVASVDAPVSGGDVGARNAALSIMVGGDAEVVNALMPLLACMGKTIVHQGPAGAGQHTKMVNQILIASNMVAVCEGLLYGYKAGLDLEKVIQSVGGGAAGSWSINNLGPRILRRDFAAGFFVEHFIKDMGIALAEAARMGIALPGLALAHQLYQSVKALGHGRSGTQALMLALERMAGVEAAKG